MITYRVSDAWQKGISVLSILLFTLLVTSCSTGNRSPVRPQYLTFNYHIQAADAAAVVNSLRNGAVTIADLMPPHPCNFSVDLSLTEPDFIISGMPGQSGFNITITASNPIQIPVIQPTNITCADVGFITLNIGSQNTATSIGNATNKSNADIELNGQAMNTESTGFFKTTLLDYANGNYVVGEFEFMVRIPGGNIALVIGSYAGID